MRIAIQRRFFRRAAIAVAGCSVWAGCTGPGQPRPPRLQAAAEQARAGERAYLGGRPREAVGQLQESVRSYVAAGDLPAAAHARLNRGLAERAAGDRAAAERTAAELRETLPAAQQQARERDLKNEAPAFELAAGAAWFEALLMLDRGEPSAADSLLATVAYKLPRSSPWPGRIATLRAETALAGGRAADALLHARAGQLACALAHDRSEEARAQRIAGQAHVQLAQWPEARRRFLSAIKIEETLGTGKRMAGDLEQLATISQQLGDSNAASLYTARAQAITSVR